MQVAEVVSSSRLTPRRLTLRHSRRAFSFLLAGILSATPALAQSSADFFLHGAGATANPPTLFLDRTAPTDTTAKFKDSTSINFSGGNPWKEVGTWPADPALTAGTLSALSDLQSGSASRTAMTRGPTMTSRPRSTKTAPLSPQA